MGYAFGLAPNGAGTGTSPEDLQRVIWGFYRTNEALIVKGLEVTGTATMAYQIAAGVAFIPTGAERAVLVPINAVQVPTTAAPSSGSRTDVIYVGQDGAVKVGSTLPAGSAEIDRRTVPAGITATTATTGLTDRKFAMLYGATMGRLARWVDSTAYGAAWPTASALRYSTWIKLSGDRLLDFRLSQTLGSSIATALSSVIWEIWLDGVHIETREMAISIIANTQTTVFSRYVTAGDHRVELRARLGVNGGGTIKYFGGGSLGFPGNVFEIIDVGLVW